MFIELHILQNFAPSNLNRDDTNSPKACDFGGFRRARVSSQCWKRAMRTYFESGDLLPESSRSFRTKRLVAGQDAEHPGPLVQGMMTAGKSREEAEAVAWAALGSIKITADKNREKSQYLIFLGREEAQTLTEVCLRHWDVLLEAAGAAPAEGTKQKKGTEAPAEVASAVRKAFEGGKAAAVSLFGRMLADAPDLNVDAAAQVAHAISTHAVETDFDFYTAVDDLKPDDTAGADMIGTIEFNSACFYRYLNVDLEQLRKNLEGDDELIRASLAAFVESAVCAIPTGKQNSMGAHNPPSVVLAVAGNAAPRNLANAFVDPIFASRGNGLVIASAAKMIETRADLGKLLGTDKEIGAWICATEDVKLNGAEGSRVSSLRDLIGQMGESATRSPQKAPA